jgi:hypothetical protein
MGKNSITRRTFLIESSGAPGAVLAANRLAPAAGAPAAGEQTATASNATKTAANVIPACAWRRAIGDLPKIALMEKMQGDDPVGLNTLARVKKGIPLGGIGAGNFMYNICGSFGPWQMKVGRYEERFLAQAAFHGRERAEGKLPTLRTLAADDVLPAWPRLAPGEGLHQRVRFERFVEVEVGQTRHIEACHPHRANDRHAEEVRLLLECLLQAHALAVRQLKALLDELAVRLDVQIPLAEAVHLARLLAHHHGHQSFAHPG